MPELASAGWRTRLTGALEWTPKPEIDTRSRIVVWWPNLIKRKSPKPALSAQETDRPQIFLAAGSLPQALAGGADPIARTDVCASLLGRECSIWKIRAGGSAAKSPFFNRLLHSTPHELVYEYQLIRRGEKDRSGAFRTRLFRNATKAPATA